MINKNYIHLLNYFASKNLLTGESKLLYKVSAGDFEIKSTKERKKDQLKTNQQQLEEAVADTKEYEKGFDKYMTKTVSLKVEKSVTSGRKLVLDLYRKFYDSTPQNIRNTEGFKDFVRKLPVDINAIIMKNRNVLGDNMPFTISLEKGGIIRFHNNKKFNLAVDIRKESPRFVGINNLRESVIKLRKELNKRKTEVVKKAKVEHQEHRTNVQKGVEKDPPANFGKLLSKENGKYLVKTDKGYVVKFLSPKGRIDRKAEKEITINDLFDFDKKLAGGNVYITMVVEGVTRSGRKFKHDVVYHPGARQLFIVENGRPTSRRPLVFHDTTITNIKYEVGEVDREEPTPIAPAKPKTAPKAGPKGPSDAELIRAHDASLAFKYRDYIFGNKKFDVPAALQHDENWEQNWKYANQIIDKVLNDPPFGPMSTPQRRKFLQEVIQGKGALDLNKNLYAEDFFETKLPGGRDLYKGGYKKYLEDREKNEKQMDVRAIDPYKPVGPEEKTIVKKYFELEKITHALGRIFNAIDQLKQTSTLQVDPETKVDTYRSMFLDMKKIEKEPKGIKYHSLESLLHKQENAPRAMNIGVTDSILSNIHNQFMTWEDPEFNPGPLLKSKGGLKLLFMAFGLRKLIAEGCLKQVEGNSNKFVLVKLPKIGWAAAIASLKTEKAKLWDSSQANFAKWERIRASLSRSANTRLFIKTIFSPGNGTVKQNFNWWQGLWHGRAIWKKDQKISMAFLGKISINPSEFEKFMTNERGYIDMIEKTSKRVEGTSLYEPQEDLVLNKTNRYIQYGILSILENVPKGEKRRKAIDKLVTDLGIKSRLNLDSKQEMDAFAKMPTEEILDEIYNEVELNNLNPKSLKSKKGLIKLIKIGFVIGRKVEATNKWSETMGKHMSRFPMIRKAQLEALKNGCPLHKLKDVEARIHAAIAGGISGNLPHYAKKVGAGGLGVAVQIFKTKGHSMYISLGAFAKGGKNVSTQIIPFGAISGRIQLKENVHMRFAVGASPTFVGAGAAIEFPITKTWDMYIGASAGVETRTGRAGGSFGIGANFNQGRLEKQEIAKKMAKFKDIDKAIEKGTKAEAARLILSNSDIGPAMRKYKELGEMTDASLVEFYQLQRPGYINFIRRGVKIPTVVGFGVNVFASSQGFGAGAYMTFKVFGTEVTYVVRKAHPQYNEYIQSKAAQIDLEKQLKADGVKHYKIAKYVVSANTGSLYFDSNVQRSQVGRSKEKGTPKPVIAKRTNHQVEKFQTSFDLVKKQFKKLDMHVEKVKDPKNPKGYLLAITPLKTMKSNIEVLMDPALTAKGLIMDKANNRFLIASDAAKDLYITRSTYRYPFNRRGAMNLQVIAFKASPSTSDAEIRQKSPRYLYKFAGKKYKLMNGENRTESRVNNVMSVAGYARTKTKFETYTDIKLEYTEQDGKDKSKKLRDAVEFGKIEVIRSRQLKLAKFGDWLYQGKGNEKFQKEFSRKIGKIKNIKGENQFKRDWFDKISNKFAVFLGQNKDIKPRNAKLNEQEKNLMYAYLLDKNFSQLRNKNTPPSTITERLRIRNNLFKSYMSKYIDGFIKNNEAQWKEIKAKYPGSNSDKVIKAGILDFLVKCMPQDSKALDRFFKRIPLPLGKGIKYASYTHRGRALKGGALEAMPTGFGGDVSDPAFKNVLRLVGPTRLNINSKNPSERVAANLILRMMSPIPTQNIGKIEGKKKFLYSELSLLLMEMQDPNTGISPLIKILGVKKFEGLTKIMEAIKGKNPTTIKNALNSKIGAEAFEDFKSIVLGIRKTQLDGKAVFIYKGKFKFYVTKTRIWAGPYLKCGNGTVAVEQKLAVRIMGSKEARLFAGKTDMNIITGTEERKAYGKFTAGFAGRMKFRSRGHKRPTPPREDKPHKTPVVAREPKPAETIGSGSTANPAPDTAVQPTETSEGTGNL